jgi:hypothetical protein
MTNDQAAKTRKAPYVPPTLHKQQRLEEVVEGAFVAGTHGTLPNG